MPTGWIHKPCNVLPQIKWHGDAKSNYTAALMVYISLCHRVKRVENESTDTKGFCKVSYDVLENATGLSRSKVSAGLKLLQKFNLIKKLEGYSKYILCNYGVAGQWCKVPVKDLYDKKGQRFFPFHGLKLRSKVELNALKVYLVIAAFRSEKLNATHLSYSKLEQYSGVHRADIKSALSLLVTLHLLQVESLETELNDHSRHNVYRLTYIDERLHRGNTPS